MTKRKGNGPAGQHEMPSESLGSVGTATFEQEQKACVIVADNALNAADARVLMAMLGIVPSWAYFQLSPGVRGKGIALQ